MALVSLNCPNCGGSLKMEDTMEKGFCMYCGTSFLVKDEIQRVQVEHRGTVNFNLNREKEVENLLIRAEQKIDEKRMQNIEIESYYQWIIDNYIEKALDINPSSDKAAAMKRRLIGEYNAAITKKNMERLKKEKEQNVSMIRNAVLIILFFLIFIIYIISQWF